ncbi:MAG TPA: GAF domain-containing protein [Candidatus Melainabacteria bacterium]|nr:GAF domain-containing protein [Candidatus Melainabacteria bacterium]
MTKKPEVDITNCDQEQIHIPGSVQDFGSIVAYRKDGRITRASENVRGLLGSEARELIGKDISTVFNSEDLKMIDKSCSELLRPSIVLTLKSGEKLNALWHSGVDEQYLDLLAQTPDQAVYTSTMSSLGVKLSATGSEQQLAQLIADVVREVSEFDRVKVYKFDRDWNGAVIAESRKNNIASYRGLHFPHTDIPKQARELYIRNRYRVIADVDGAQSRIVEEPGLAPLDLSFSFLRSVSPIHLQYLRNMNVRASMSISLFEKGKFWGLIACHHESARRFTLQEFSFYQTLSQLCSNRLTDLHKLAESEIKLRYLSKIQDIAANLLDSHDLKSLMQCHPTLDELIQSTGNVLVAGGNILRKNATPDNPTLHSIIEWLECGPNDEVFACDDLPARYGHDIGAYACGLLAAKIPNHNKAWLMWLRPEMSKSVDWAGDPFKPSSQSPYGERLYPRTSFELWKETVKGISIPWQPWEIEAAGFLSKILSKSMDNNVAY